MAISIESSIGELVAAGIHRARVFETYGIDYCCGGRMTLAEACRKADRSPEEVIAALGTADRDVPEAGSETADWRAANLDSLTRHIVDTRQAGTAVWGSVGNPIRVLEHEHDDAGISLGRIRELTDDYTVPQDGFSTYSALPDKPAAIERDLHEHIHNENNILHPRAARLEADLLAAVRGGM